MRPARAASGKPFAVMPLLSRSERTLRNNRRGLLTRWKHLNLRVTKVVAKFWTNKADCQGARGGSPLRLLRRIVVSDGVLGPFRGLAGDFCLVFTACEIHGGGVGGGARQLERARVCRLVDRRDRAGLAVADADDAEHVVGLEPALIVHRFMIALDDAHDDGVGPEAAFVPDAAPFELVAEAVAVGDMAGLRFAAPADRQLDVGGACLGVDARSAKARAAHQRVVADLAVVVDDAAGLFDVERGVDTDRRLRQGRSGEKRSQQHWQDCTHGARPPAKHGPRLSRQAAAGFKGGGCGYSRRCPLWKGRVRPAMGCQWPTLKTIWRRQSARFRTIPSPASFSATSPRSWAMRAPSAARWTNWCSPGPA